MSVKTKIEDIGPGHYWMIGCHEGKNTMAEVYEKSDGETAELRVRAHGEDFPLSACLMVGSAFVKIAAPSTEDGLLWKHLNEIGVHSDALEDMFGYYKGLSQQHFPIVRQYDPATKLGELISYSRAPILVKLVKVPAGSRAKQAAPTYGVIQDILKGEWQGPKSIICREGDDWREVCTFNRGGGIWGQRESAELQAVLAALQRPA
jgi:hypothetical protein